MCEWCDLTTRYVHAKLVVQAVIFVFVFINAEHQRLDLRMVSLVVGVPAPGTQQYLNCLVLAGSTVQWSRTVVALRPITNWGVAVLVLLEQMVGCLTALI